MKNECNTNKNNDNEQEGISARVSIRAVSVGVAQDETKARSGVRLGEAFVHIAEERELPARRRCLDG